MAESVPKLGLEPRPPGSRGHSLSRHLLGLCAASPGGRLVAFLSGLGWALEKAGLARGVRLLLCPPSFPDSRLAVRGWVVSFKVSLEHLPLWACGGGVSCPVSSAVSFQSHLQSMQTPSETAP